MNGAKELLKAFYIIIITAFIVSAVIVLILEVTFLILDSDSTPSEIINYHPTVFKEEAVEPFFYSIGTELKRSKAIDPHARTLFSCEKIWEAFVSPDNRMILLICGGRPEDGMLWLVSFDGGIRRKVVEVKDIDKKRSTPGEYFIKGDGIQWSPDSQSFYVIRDQYSSEGRHTLTPLNGSLLRYDVGQERFEEVIQKFPSYYYFFGESGRIYYRIWNERSKGELRCWQGDRACDAAYTMKEKSIFYSFSDWEYRNDILPDQGLYMEKRPQITSIYQETKRGKRLLLEEKWGHSFKGGYDSVEVWNSVYLPGERYLPLEVRTKQFKGPLLIDTVTGLYRELPPKTRVYRNFNTRTKGIRYEIQDGYEIHIIRNHTCPN